MNVYGSVHELIGNTPVIEIKQLPIPNNCRIFAKLEYLNPGGSVKDRLGLSLIEDAEEFGKLLPGGTIIEPTAGNAGIGLALAAIGKGYNVMFVVPDKFSVEKQVLMRALGAVVINTETSLGMQGAIDKARGLVLEIPGAYSPSQYQIREPFQSLYSPLHLKYYRTLQIVLQGIPCSLRTALPPD